MRVPLKAVLRELNRRNISFGQPFDYPNMYAPKIKSEQDLLERNIFGAKQIDELIHLAKTGILESKYRDQFLRRFEKDMHLTPEDKNGRNEFIRLYHQVLSPKTSNEHKLQCLIKIKSQFLKWAEQHKKNVDKMKRGLF